MPSVTVSSPVVLPCGLTLPNRLVKSAMTEGLADTKNRATEELVRLYERWGEAECGLLVTGNIMVDRRYMEAPGNVAIDGEQSKEQLERLRKFALAGKKKGSRVFAQIGHAGRQSSKHVNKHLVGPSAIPVKDPRPDSPFGSTTRALTVEEIKDIQARFKYAIQVCKDVGFDGVEIHGAHGYLISSFFNPLANQRTDEYGGSLENRARLLLDILADVQHLRDETFAIGVKINSSDFQRGGFSLDDCKVVLKWLDKAGIDMIEISGGSYEEIAFLAKPGKNKSTIEREAFFLEFGAQVAQTINNAKLCVAGGFRKKSGMNVALQKGDCDLIGVARPLCIDAHATRKLLHDETDELPRVESVPLPWFLKPLYMINFGNKLEFFAQQAHCYRCIHAMGHGLPFPDFQAVRSVLSFFWEDRQKAASLQGISRNV